MASRRDDKIPWLISAGVFAVFASLLGLGFVQELEFKAIDSLQTLRYRWSGPVVHPDLAVISIDDQSVDPAASPLADLWGRGGWLTRDLWAQQMQFHTDFFRPRILAYDILFFQSRQEARSAGAEALSRLQLLGSLSDRRRQVEELERSGNDELENQILNMADARAAGMGPEPILGYVFPEDAGPRQAGFAASEETRSLMQAQALPDGIVEGAWEGPVYEQVQLPMPAMVQAGAGLGLLNVPLDAGGVVRRVPLVLAFRENKEGPVRYYPGLGFMAFLRAQGLDPARLHPLGRGVPGLLLRPGREMILDRGDGQPRLRVPIDGRGRVYLNSRFRFKDVKTNLSYIRVSEAGLILANRTQKLSGRPPAPEELEKAVEIAGHLKDRVVFVAQAFTGSGDIGNFPLQENTPNVMAHLTLADNLLRGDFLREPSTTWTLGVGFLLAVVSALLYRQMSPVQASFCLAACVVLVPVVALAWMIWNGRVVHPLACSALGPVLLSAHAIHQYNAEARRRREVRKLFSAMVSPRVLDLMEQNPSSYALEGQRMEAIMFFSDVAGFTSISEKLTPQELSSLLNRYLTPMSEIILSSDGYIDKYQGDGIMAVWGVPFPDPEHAVKACRAARDQLRALGRLAAEIESECGVRIDIRIGINSGTVSAGNMGSERKFQYTVMGDAVNLAARLEPANKDYGSRCIIGPLTRKAVAGASDIVCRRLDRIVVKGKTEPVEIFELCELERVEPWLQQYNTALEALWARRWDEAERGFRAVLAARPGDGAACLMLSRLEAYRQDPPPDGWNGAWVRQAKD